MLEFWNYIIDVLGEFGSGAGDPNDEYVRFGLGTVFFSILLVMSLRNRKGRLRTRETILSIGFGLGLLRELFKFVIKSLEIHGGVETATLELFFPPLEHALFALSRVFIAAGFIFFFLETGRLAIRFLQVGTLLTVGFYVVSAPIWWSIVAETPTAKFSHFIGDWVIHSFGVVLGSVAVGLFLMSGKRGFLIVSAVFACFLLDDVLQLINLGTGEVYKATFAPIRHNLHIWGIFALGFLYLRELTDEKRRLEVQLHHRERLEAVGQLAAGVAHDFNNILQVIMGFTEVARDGGGDQEIALNQIEGASQRGTQLVRQLLTYSRQDVKSEGLCNVDATITGMSGMFRNILGASIELRLDLNADSLFVGITATQLEQILVNLLVNASHAMPDGGVVTIASSLQKTNLDDRILQQGESDVVRIEVTDTGSGMSDATLNKAFNPFYTTKPVGQGSGLGLASVLSIVEHANGTVTAKSKPGRGTIITIDLPPVANISKAPEKLPERIHRKGSETILLAEDETALATLFSGYLNGAGYNVLAASNGAEAVRMFEANPQAIDLCLFDVALPEMTGYRAYSRILDSGRKIPVIFMSGKVDANDPHTAAHTHVAKPFDRETLLRHVQKKFS